jgi:hypothetical protein
LNSAPLYNVYIPHITHLICIYCTLYHLLCLAILMKCITGHFKECHFYMFTYPTLLISLNYIPSTAFAYAVRPSLIHIYFFYVHILIHSFTLVCV